MYNLKRHCMCHQIHLGFVARKGPETQAINHASASVTVWTDSRP